MPSVEDGQFHKMSPAEEEQFKRLHPLFVQICNEIAGVNGMGVQTNGRVIVVMEYAPPTAETRQKITARIHEVEPDIGIDFHPY